MADSQGYMKCQDDHTTLCQDEYPQKADLRRMMAEQPLPSIPASIIDSDYMTSEESTKKARDILSFLNTALNSDDQEMLERCFYTAQTYWKDELALTYHLRTFTTPSVIAASLLETKALRQIVDGFIIDGEANLVSPTPTLVSKCLRSTGIVMLIGIFYMCSTLLIVDLLSGRTLQLPHAVGGWSSCLSQNLITAATQSSGRFGS